MAAKKSSKIIIWLLLIVFFVAAFMFIKVFSNNFTTDIKTFYVKLDGEIITTDQQNVKLANKTIEVHSLIDDVTQDKKGFKYQIVRNTSVENFMFYADGERKTFSDNQDYSSAFEAQVTKTTLSLQMTSLLQVLRNVYGTQNIELPETIRKDVCYFTLKITSSDGQKEIKLDFLTLIGDESITLDVDHVEF